MRLVRNFFLWAFILMLNGFALSILAYVWLTISVFQSNWLANLLACAALVSGYFLQTVMAQLRGLVWAFILIYFWVFYRILARTWGEPELVPVLVLSTFAMAISAGVVFISHLLRGAISWRLGWRHFNLTK